MKNLALLSALAALSATTAFQWPTERVYNRWHETKLERWLKDHNIPYPAASDRKSLADKVAGAWEAATPPYATWTESQLRAWLTEGGHSAADYASSSKDELVALVTGSYNEAADESSSLANWILDSWTDSQLKSFLDYHNIPNPTPRNRDTLLQSARSAYSNLVSTGPSIYDSLFGEWSDSDLKAWCDARGIPVPQGSTKNSMLASMRENTHSFTEQAKSWFTRSSSFKDLDAAGLTKMLKANKVDIPKGAKIEDLRALADKNYKSLKNAAGDYYSAGANKADEAAAEAKKHGNKAYNAAADKANDAAAEAKKQGNKAYNAAAEKANDAAAEAKKQGSNAYDAAADKANDAAAEAKKQGNKAYNAAADKAQSVASNAQQAAESVAAQAKAQAGAAYDNVKAKVVGGADEAAKSAESLKNKGTKAAGSAADQATKAAGSAADQATKSVANAYAQVSDDVTGESLFNFWSDSRLKAFLDSRGVPVPQNGKSDELAAACRKHARTARKSADDFEGWTTAQLNKFAKDAKIKLDKTAASSRDALIKQTQDGYAALSKTGGKAADEAKRQYEGIQGYAFDSWSESDLKSFLDSYGVPVPQGGTKDSLVASARRNAHYFSQGQLEPVHGSPFAQMASEGLSSLFAFVKKVSGIGYEKSQDLAGDVKQRAEEARAEL